MSESRGRAGESADAVAQKSRKKAAALLAQADRYEKGSLGELRVAAILGSLPPGFHVLHDLDVPGSKANIDHLVVGPTGVVAVDTKNYSGRLTAGGGTLWNGRFPIRSKCQKAQWEADQMAGYLGVAVRAVLCVLDAELPAAVNVTDDGIVCSPDAVVGYVVAGHSVLNAEAAARLANHAAFLLRNPSTRSVTPLVAEATSWSPIRSAAPAVPPARSAFPTFRSVRRSLSEKPPRARRNPPKILWKLAALLVMLALLAPASRLIAGVLTAQFKASLPASMTPATTPNTTVPASTTTTVALVDAPPTFSFECPSPAEGWTAAMVATQYLQDPSGYHTWYRIGGVGNSWIYAGTFRSGLNGPAALGGIASDMEVELRYDRRGMMIDPETSEGYVSFVTAAGC